MRNVKIISILFIIFLFVDTGNSNQWQVVGNMPHPVSGGEAVVIDSLIVILGGNSDSLGAAIDFTQIYNPRTNSWVITSQLVESRSGFVADKYGDSSIVSCGGIWESSINLFSLEIWNYIDPILPSRIYNHDYNFGRVNFNGHVKGDNLYLIGGRPSPAIGDSLELAYIVEYHVPSATVTFTDYTIFNRFFLPYDQMSQIVDEDIYIFGGALLGLTEEIYKFNVSTKIFEYVRDLLGKRAGGEAIHSNDNIYIIGGYNELLDALSSVEVYNKSTDSLTAGPPLNFERSDFMAVEYENSIYVFGGLNSLSFSVPTIEKLDLITNINRIPDEKPKVFLLKNNYPNPFNASTTLSFNLKKNAEISLDIFTVGGEHVITIINGKLPVGEHRYIWDGKNKMGNEVASGIYIFSLKNNSFISSNKMILLR